jgi:hypothetical protein
MWTFKLPSLLDVYEIQMQIHLPVHVRIRRRQGRELVKKFISYMYVRLC